MRNNGQKKKSAAEKGRFRRLWDGFCRVCAAIGARFRRTNLSLYAAQATYYVLFSAIPFLALLFMMVERIFPREIEGLLDFIRSALPPLISGGIPEIFWDTVLSVSVPTLSVAVISLVFAASKGMKAVSDGLCAIYGVSPGRGILSRTLWSMLYTVGFLLLLIFSLTLLVFGRGIHSLIEIYLPSLLPFVDTLLTLRGLISIGVFTLVFTICYKCMAARKWKIRSLLPGALFSGGGWILFSYFFSLYLKYFSGYSTLYGALGVLMVLMIWIHSCIMLLLLGAELNVFLAGSHIA